MTVGTYHLLYIKLLEILKKLEKERQRLKSEEAAFERQLNLPKDLKYDFEEQFHYELEDIETDISIVQKRVDRIYPLLKKWGYFDPGADRW